MDNRALIKKVEVLEDEVSRMRDSIKWKRDNVAQFVIAAALKIEDPFQKEAVMGVFKSLYETWDKI